MRKLFIFVIFSVLALAGVLSKEKFAVEKTYSTINMIYNVNGDILYFGDVLEHLEDIDKSLKVKPQKINYPIDVSYLRYHLYYEPVRKIEVYNDALEALEYLAALSAELFQETDSYKTKEKLASIYTVVAKDFRSLLKLSMREAKTTDDLYTPHFFTIMSYKKYLVTPNVYYFVYFSGIVKKGKKNR